MPRKAWRLVVVMAMLASASAYAADQAAPAKPAPTARRITVEGTISSPDLTSNPPAFKLKSSAGPTLNVELALQTAIKHDQESVKPDQLKAGQWARVTYHAAQGHTVADAIRLRSGTAATSKPSATKTLAHTPLPGTH